MTRTTTNLGNITIVGRGATAMQYLRVFIAENSFLLMWKCNVLAFIE